MQVERLHEKEKGQGLQSAAQFDRSTEQFRSPQQVLGHKVVTPSQVTDPRWPTEQFWSVAEQLVVLLLPLQLMVPPDPQFAEAVQRAFSPIAGCFAAGVGATGLAREARNARSAALGPGAAIAGDAIQPRAARSKNPRAAFFIIDLLSEQEPAVENRPQPRNIALSLYRA